MMSFVYVQKAELSGMPNNLWSFERTKDIICSEINVFEYSRWAVRDLNPWPPVVIDNDYNLAVI